MTVLAMVLAAGACSGLVDDKSADAVVQLEVDDEPAVMRVRQDVLAGAGAWGGVRVGERSGDVGATALEFTLPGENLEIALGALEDLGARVVATEIDVDAAQIERTTTTAGEQAGRAERAEPGTVRLRVEVDERAGTGAQGLLTTAVAVFSVVGVVSTVRWLRSLPGRRRARHRAQRHIDRVDLRGDPPTQETPRVPPRW